MPPLVTRVPQVENENAARAVQGQVPTPRYLPPWVPKRVGIRWGLGCARCGAECSKAVPAPQPYCSLCPATSAIIPTLLCRYIYRQMRSRVVEMGRAPAAAEENTPQDATMPQLISVTSMLIDAHIMDLMTADEEAQQVRVRFRRRKLHQNTGDPVTK